MRKILLLLVLLFIPFVFAQSVDCRQDPLTILSQLYACNNITQLENGSVQACEYILNQPSLIISQACDSIWMYDKYSTIYKTNHDAELCSFSFTENFQLNEVTLSRNYSCNGPNYAFAIYKSNFIFDCNNFHISTPNQQTSVGIEIVNAKHVTIKNCNLNNFPLAGMFLSGTSQNTVVNNTIYENNIGIQLGGGAGGVALTTFQNNTIINNTQYGIYSFSQINRDNIFTQNTFENEVNVFYRFFTPNNFFNQSTLGNYWSDWEQNPGFEEGIYRTNILQPSLSNIDFHPLQCTQDRHCQQGLMCQNFTCTAQPADFLSVNDNIIQFGVLDNQPGRFYLYRSHNNITWQQVLTINLPPYRYTFRDDTPQPFYKVIRQVQEINSTPLYGHYLPDMCDSTDTTPEFPNGFNPKLRGNITRGTQFYQDACLSPNHLMEYFCGTSVFARIIECTCKDGACLDEHKSTNFRGTILTNDMVKRT